MKKLYFLLFIPFIISCNEYEFHMSMAFVSGYYQMEHIELVESNNLLFIYGEGIKDYASLIDDDSRLFESLARKHKDISYNKKIAYLDGKYLMDPNPYCLKDDFTAIHVTSDTDYDESHPAGSNLDDVVVFHSSSPYPYIESGYTCTYDWGEVRDILPWPDSTFNHDYIDTEEWSHYIRKNVMDLCPSDLTLLGGYLWRGEPSLGILEFASKPTLEKCHTIHVELINDEGKAYRSMIEMEFH